MLHTKYALQLESQKWHLKKKKHKKKPLDQKANAFTMGGKGGTGSKRTRVSDSQLLGSLLSIRNHRLTT